MSERGSEGEAEKSRRAGVVLGATRSFEGCVQGCVEATGSGSTRL